MTVTTVSAPHEAGEATRRFHDETYVFDALSISYVLEPRFTERVLAGGVNGTNVTFALEEEWDRALANFETYLAKIEKSDLLMLCTSTADLLRAKERGKLGVVVGTQGATMLGDQVKRLDLLVRLGL